MTAGATMMTVDDDEFDPVCCWTIDDKKIKTLPSKTKKTMVIPCPDFRNQLLALSGFIPGSR